MLLTALISMIVMLVAASLLAFVFGREGKREKHTACDGPVNVACSLCGAPREEQCRTPLAELKVHIRERHER